MTQLGQLLQRRKQASVAGSMMSRLVSEVAEETANLAARRLTAKPNKPVPQPEPAPVEKVADMSTDEELAQRYRESRAVSAPTTPGEIALTTAITSGANWLTPRIQQHLPNVDTSIGSLPIKIKLKPDELPTIGGAAKQTFGPSNVLPAILIGGGLQHLSAPLADPLYHQGKRSYVKSVGEGILGSAEALRQRSNEAREKYGIGAIPLQLMHGILNPVSSLTYAGQSLGRYLNTKEGSLKALEAERDIARATCETAKV